MAKYKILGLHGYTQSGPILSKKAAALRKSLEKLGIEVICPTAPHRIIPPDTPSSNGITTTETDVGEYFGWSIMDEEKKEMRGLDESISLIGKILEDEGPFIGIFGFSQGGALTALVASMLEHGRVQNLFKKINHPPLRFFVQVSGFRWKFAQYDQFYPITTTSLHVIGSLDTVVSEARTMGLAQSCRDAEVLRHPGGHFIPNAANYRNDIVRFVEKNLPIEEKPMDRL